jgi:hypothetical protein
MDWAQVGPSRSAQAGRPSPFRGPVTPPFDLAAIRAIYSPGVESHASIHSSPHFNVFGSGVKHGISGNTNSTRAITHERYMGTLLTKITQRVCDPKKLGAKLVAATYSASAVDGATLDCLREDQETSEEPKN